MKDRVHILATVRKPELTPAATLVFRTLRVGFPGADVRVWGNGLAEASLHAVGRAAINAECRFVNVAPTVHDEWIERLVMNEPEPFWICDTDMVFWDRVQSPWEAYYAGARQRCLFAGGLEPEFEEEWTGTTHVERLHTCLMWINPGPLRAAMRQWMARIPAPWGTSAQFPLIRQTFVPHLAVGHQKRILFYDTMAGLWHAGMGTAFAKEQEECFEHLHCGTYADLVSAQAPSLAGLKAGHEMIYRDLNAAKGLRDRQREYYQSRNGKEQHAIRTPGKR